MQKRGMEENQFQEIPQTFTSGRSKKSLPKKTVVLIAFIVLVIAVVLFVRLSAKSEKQSTSTASSTPSATETPMPTESPVPSSSETPVPTPTLTPTPTPTSSANPIDKVTGLNRSKLNVLIQNGSGEAGVASKASDYLKGLGYDVSSTGNADNYDYKNVTIQVKASMSDYLTLLKKDLGFNYTIETASSDLPDSSAEDALVIIGK